LKTYHLGWELECGGLVVCGCKRVVIGELSAQVGESTEEQLPAPLTTNGVWSYGSVLTIIFSLHTEPKHHLNLSLRCRTRTRALGQQDHRFQGSDYYGVNLSVTYQTPLFWWSAQLLCINFRLPTSSSNLFLCSSMLRNAAASASKVSHFPSFSFRMRRAT